MTKSKMRDLSKTPNESQYRTRHQKAKVVVALVATVVLFILIMWLIQLVLKSAPANTL
jgi:flagellar biogenesis protein FliO